MNRRSFLRNLVSSLAGVYVAPRLCYTWTPNISSFELVKRLLQNALDHHDDLIERAIFST